jgi:hypothetical protein
MINTLLVVAGIAIFAFGYLVFYRDYTAKTEAVVNATKPLTTRLNELKAHDAKKAEYKQGIADSAKLASDTLAQFPAMIRTEDLIMYTNGIDDEASEFYPSAAQAYFPLKYFNPEVNPEDGNMFHISTISFGKPILLKKFEAKTQPDQETAANYSAYSLQTTVNATNLGYNNLKRVIRWITNYEYRTIIDSVAVNYDANTGTLAGTFMYTKVYIDDGSYEYVQTKVPEGPVGVDSPFGIIQ